MAFESGLLRRAALVITPSNWRVRCGPASAGEVEEAWSDKALDPQAVDLWAEYREALLFNDTEYGQWGLKILSPGRSAEVTASEAAERPSDFQLYDVVFGEF
jgi:hypothetical protein